MVLKAAILTPPAPMGDIMSVVQHVTLLGDVVMFLSILYVVLAGQLKLWGVLAVRLVSEQVA